MRDDGAAAAGSQALKLGVLMTHPIQYYSPLFRRLHHEAGVDLTVYYAHRPTAAEQGVGFGVPFQWDVDLTSGYRSVWLGCTATGSRRAGPPDGFLTLRTPEIADVIRRERFDAFLVGGWHALTYWQAMKACWDTGTPLLVRGDSQLSHRDPSIKRYAKRVLYPQFVRRIDACLSVGERSERYFRHYGARRVVRAPHFVDNALFSAAAAGQGSQGSARDKLGISRNALVCLFAGKFVAKKRPGDLVAALSKIGTDPTVGLFVGDGALRGQCEQDAARLGVTTRFTGFLNQSQIALAYRAADLLVLPSDQRETWGLVVNEAMASGLPVIVSDAVGCAPDLVLEGKTGHVFSLGNVNQLAAIISDLQRDRPRLAALGEGARLHVREFSVDAAAAGILSAARGTQRHSV